MTSKEQNKAAAAAALHHKLQQLRSLTSSTAVSKASILVDASKYIQELKQKVDACRKDLAEGSSESPMEGVSVETLEKGFLINVVCDKNCPGLLVSVLEAFEELGLDVMDANVSCANSFRLEAVGGQLPQDDSVDAQMVRQAVVRAIKKCTGRGAN